jgi:hypothetical protein
MPSNMSLVVNITLSGSQNQRGGWSLTPTYAQGSTIPPSSNVVGSDGSITLANMAKTDAYNNATQVSFVITGVNVTDRSNRPATVYFASPRSAAISFDPANGTEFSGFGDEGSGDILTFLDADDDHGSYNYCLTVTCFENGSTTGTDVPLDPRIVNRP